MGAFHRIQEEFGIRRPACLKPLGDTCTDIPRPLDSDWEFVPCLETEKSYQKKRGNQNCLSLSLKTLTGSLNPPDQITPNAVSVSKIGMKFKVTVSVSKGTITIHVSVMSQVL